MWNKIKKPILALAPMAGITDSAFRLICREMGADVVYSEMASVAALYFKPKKTLELLRFSAKEQPYVVQLFGKNPDQFAKAAAIASTEIPVIKYPGKNESIPIESPKQRKSESCNVTERRSVEKPAGIDINFGCPAKKVFGHGSGAALMNQPKLAQEIIKAVIANTDLPVSIKVRTEVNGVTIMDFLKQIKANRLGLAAVMVHGRSYRQGFKGPINLEEIREVKKYFEGVVLANGGIKTIEDAERTLQETGVDGLGIATGIYGNPGLFVSLQQLKKGLPRGSRTETNPPQTKTALRHARYAYHSKGEHGIVEMRKHLLWYLKGTPNAKALRERIVAVRTPKDIQDIVQTINVSC